MRSYIIRRLIQAFVVLTILSMAIFFLIRWLPGDPILVYIAEEELFDLTPEQIERLRHEFGLDRPVVAQYIDWVGGIFRGDFGTSVFYRLPVSTLIAERLPVTAHLGSLAFILSSIVGIFAGAIAAVRRGKWPDTVSTVLANLGITTPSFWLGILLIYLFGVTLGWLPIEGYTSPFKDFWFGTKQLIMPVFCLSVFTLASTARQTRSIMLEVIQQDYIRTAHAKGLSERLVLSRHAIRNALIPVVTLLGTRLRLIFGGAVLIEVVFNIPGIGRLLTNAVFLQDYAIVQSGVMVVGLIVVFGNLLVDISYGWLDPRIRHAKDL